MAVNLTHRENDLVAQAVRQRMKASGRLSDVRAVTAYQTLGWTAAEKGEIEKLNPGMVLEQTRGKEKGRAWVIESIAKDRAYATSNGQVRYFDKSHARSFDVCEQRTLELGGGDEILMRSASKPDRITNGERLRIARWDHDGNPVSSEGRVIRHRNFCYGYAATVRRVQGDSATRVIVGFDRHSVRTATKEPAYVAGSLGREFCEVLVESVQELSQIQNRSGDRKSVMEMVIDPERKLQPDLRELLAEVNKSPKQVKAQSLSHEISQANLQAGKMVRNRGHIQNEKEQEIER